MTLYLEMRIDFVRKYPDDQQTISQEWTVTITQDQKNDFLAMLDTNSTQSSVLFPHVFGQYYRLPMTGNPIIPEATSTEERLLPIQLSLNRELATEELVVNNTKTQVENVVEFWEFKSPQPNVWSNQNPVLGADVVVTSTLVPTGPLSGLATAGIIGLYIGVVLAIGKVLRSAVSDLQYNIMWKELPNPQPIIDLCHDIFLARQAGQLEIEQSLYRELIELYRSPESMIFHTKIQ
eukprot:TRINITY_DN10087_c0_g1_i2.p1 TRINITY_DN10087_c0_g1~~TRINITY_DN10087_c0_g1_i2.p1  ORF type:complete len:235 (-),score=26.08 TRINITY_DN10087_c0_g1_i2:222-926(-)